MFVKSIKIAQNAMFPIFRWVQIDSRQVKVGVGGTGFFINADGYFVSVAHVFDNAVQGTRFLYIGKLPENLQKPPLQISEICRNDDLDIYVGKVELETPQHFQLSSSVPDIGMSVCVGGYPLAKITLNAQGGPDLGQVRRYFQPTFVLDKAIVSGGQGKVRKHDGFLMRDVGLFGMSGGPVFDIDGVVVGIQASITKPRESTNGGRTISVENALAIRSNLILDLLNQHNIMTS